MKKVIKKTPDIPETLTEETKPKGGNVSVYLDAETFQFLNRLVELEHKGKSEIVQEMIRNSKRSLNFVLPYMIDSFGLDSKKKDEVSAFIRKIADE